MKLRIGDKVEFDSDLDYIEVIILGFGYDELKQGDPVYSKEYWFYTHQITKINGIKVHNKIEISRNNKESK